MSTPSFLDTLRLEVAKFQATHPEREAELARAHALILHGMVVPSPADPETGQVLSSNGQKVYHVNGVCDCDAGQHGRGCKHVHGWRLYQYVQRKLDAQTPQMAQEPTSASQTTGDTSAAVDAPTALPEAPASANVRVTIAGRECQITLRDADEGRLLSRLEALLQRFPIEKASSPPQNRGNDWCSIHNVTMKLNHGKDGRTWLSHKTADGQWCKGKARR
jgi:hypothetical protein